jgi:hypothetical protein
MIDLAWELAPPYIAEAWYERAEQLEKEERSFS